MVASFCLAQSHVKVSPFSSETAAVPLVAIVMTQRIRRRKIEESDEAFWDYVVHCWWYLETARGVEVDRDHRHTIIIVVKGKVHRNRSLDRLYTNVE